MSLTAFFWPLPVTISLVTDYSLLLLTLIYSGGDLAMSVEEGAKSCLSTKVDSCFNTIPLQSIWLASCSSALGPVSYYGYRLLES